MPVRLLRIILLGTSAAAGWVAPAGLAQQAPGPARFSLSPSGDGFIRLDTMTGAVSHCTAGEGVWRCEPADQTGPDALRSSPDGAAIAARLEKLEAAVARLSAMPAEMEALRSALRRIEARVPGGRPSEAETPAPARTARPKQAAEGFGYQLAGRMQRFILALRRGAANATPE